MVASHVPCTGHLGCHPGVCPDWELNWQPFGSQAHTRSTQLYQAGLVSVILCQSWQTNLEGKEVDKKKIPEATKALLKI